MFARQPKDCRTWIRLPLKKSEAVTPELVAKGR